MVEIATSRLILREFVSADWVAVHDYANDFQVCQYMEWGPNTVGQSKDFVQKAIYNSKEKSRRNYELAITQRAAPRLALGAISLLLDLEREPAHQGWIGYVLDCRHWCKGITTEAAMALIDFAFGSLGLQRVAAACDPNNTASFKVMEKCGMQREGLLRQNKYVKGSWRDTLCYSILSSEWQENKAQKMNLL
jgi:RimJ/RimL family protein N-acetyltransferase